MLHFRGGYHALLIFGDINKTLQNIAALLQGFLYGALFLAFAYGGYLWMTSHSNPSRRSESYAYLFGAVFGAIVVVLAGQIALSVQNAIK